VCTAIPDPGGGGYFALAPEDPSDVSRRYLPDTNVLDTTFAAQAGTVRVTDALNVGSAGRLPWTELARRVEGLTGEVAMLLYEPGGPIDAAATTSLPEAIGGVKNYDCRCARVRDSSFTLDAFIRLGLREEVHTAVCPLQPGRPGGPGAGHH